LRFILSPLPMQTNFNRQFQHLQIGCNEIINEDGFISHGRFYEKLEAYIKFYEEMKPILLKTYENDEFVLEKVKSLPKMEFKNYDNPFSFRSILFVFAYFLFFPIGIVYMIRKYSYVSGIKSSLREISSAISSLQFLMKANE
jgi:hypothetical protein